MKMNPLNMGLAALIGIGGVGFAATAASAAVVCNDEGDCWHVKDKIDYPPGVQLHVYGDDWKWGPNDHYKWNDHDGRGYWKGGAWIGF